MDANIRLDHSLVSLETETDVHVMLELSTPAAPETSNRPPLRVALVLDRSGSMVGEKLANAKKCAAWLAGRMTANDQLALVDFDDNVRLLAPLGAPAAVGAVVPRIQAGGSTNLSGGWLKGVEQLRGAGGKVIVLTDGHANVGITDSPTLVSLARGSAGDGVGTTTIGIGDDFDEDLLTAFADAGGGNAHYAASPDAAPAIFAEELENLTTLHAQNASIEVRPGAQVEFVGVLNDYPTTAVAGGVQMQLGDLYSGETRRVVLAFHVPALAELGAVPIADLVLRYVSVGDEVAAHEVKIPVAVNLVSADEAAASSPDLQVVEEVLVLKAAEARADAIRRADEGDFDGAQHSLRASAASLRKAGLFDEAASLDEAVQLTLDQQAYSAPARKRLRYDAHMVQRKRHKPEEPDG